MDHARLHAVVARQWSAGALLAFDGVVAVGYTVVLLLTAFAHRPGPWWQYLLVVAIGLPCALRRRWPLPVFGTVLAATGLAVVAGVVREPFAAAAFALYTVALTERRRLLPTYVVAGTSLALLLVEFVAGTPGWWKDDLLDLAPTGLALLGAAWVVGRAVRERRAYAARSAAEHAGRAVAEERLRIARELHDVVAHSMGVIAVEAGVTRHVLESRAAGESDALVHDALHSIETTSRDALRDMRRMLGVLRQDGGPDELGPAPGVAQLPKLVDQAGAAGVAAALEVRDVDGLPEGVQLTIYRIVQEALTNVVKHAAGARCRVSVEHHRGEVRIEVADDGSAAAPPHPDGHGLVGMRERVAMYGGEFSAGRTDGGGFRVFARLPCAGAVREESA
ncbi:sensor histidine kinase [Amycolatopsis sp. NPDC005003]